MAIVKFVISGSPMNNIFPYIMKKEKSEQKLISGINCMSETAMEEFIAVKKQFGNLFNLEIQNNSRRKWMPTTAEKISKSSSLTD